MRRIVFSIHIGFKDPKDEKVFRGWVGTNCPSEGYQLLAAKLVGDALTAAKMPASDIPAFERFSINVDHSENKQWNEEFSSLAKIGKLRWKLGNQKLRKDDNVWVRLGGRWILAKVDHSEESGYSLIIEPEHTLIPLSSDLKMRWSVYS